MNLSYPKGCLVNDGVAKNKYLDTYCRLHYPSLDYITQAIRDLGPEALLFKIDISRAFCHLRIDPDEIDLLGIQYNDFYCKGSLTFSFRYSLVNFSVAQTAYDIS